LVAIDLDTHALSDRGRLVPALRWLELISFDLQAAISEIGHRPIMIGYGMASLQATV